MIKALLLKLTGARFEVRRISPTTGKDIPGRCLFKVNFWKDRKAYMRAEARLKYGQTLRLQAVSVMTHTINIVPPYDPQISAVEAQGNDTVFPPEGMEHVQVATVGEPIFKDLLDHDCVADGPLEC